MVDLKGSELCKGVTLAKLVKCFCKILFIDRKITKPCASKTNLEFRRITDRPVCGIWFPN